MSGSLVEYHGTRGGVVERHSSWSVDQKEDQTCGWAAAVGTSLQNSPTSIIFFLRPTFLLYLQFSLPGP